MFIASQRSFGHLISILGLSLTGPLGSRKKSFLPHPAHLTFILLILYRLPYILPDIFNINRTPIIATVTKSAHQTQSLASSAFLTGLLNPSILSLPHLNFI